MGNERNPRQLITKMWAKGFRSLKSVEVELSPLTVLVGPNSSGKSNLLDILGFVADAVWYDFQRILPCFSVKLHPRVAASTNAKPAIE